MIRQFPLTSKNILLTLSPTRYNFKTARHIYRKLNTGTATFEVIIHCRAYSRCTQYAGRYYEKHYVLGSTCVTASCYAHSVGGSQLFPCWSCGSGTTKIFPDRLGQILSYIEFWNMYFSTLSDKYISWTMMKSQSYKYVFLCIRAWKLFALAQ